MMKKLLLFLILLSFTLVLFSETIIDTPIVYGHWDTDNSPYLIMTDIEIPQGASLEIDPGVTIVMNSEVKITANGNIYANGTEDNLIYFQGENESTSWTGIEVNSSDNNFVYTNIVGACKGLSLYKTNYVDYCNITGYGSENFEEGIYIGDGNQSEISNLNIIGYMSGVVIRAGEDDDDDAHEPTTPTMDVIRIYYSPDSWKDGNSVVTQGIVMDTKVEPTLTNIEIENYDEGITIRAGEDDDDDAHEPTTPTMDVIRIYYSPDSWKGTREEASRGIVIEGQSNASLSNVEIENYDEGITIRAGEDDDDDAHEPTTPTMDVIRIYYSPDSWKGERSSLTRGIVVEGNVNHTLNNAEIENYQIGIDLNTDGNQTFNGISLPNNLSDQNNYGFRVKGRNSIAIDSANITNYDNAISLRSGAQPVVASILNTVITNNNSNRNNSKAIDIKGAVNLLVDNNNITDFDSAINLKNNYQSIVQAKIENTEIYQTSNRRGNYKGIELTGKVIVEINNNVIKSCDPAITVQGTNSQSMINRNLIFIPFHKNNSKGIDVSNISQNIMKNNTIHNYDKGLTSHTTPTELVNNIIWKTNSNSSIVSNFDYVEARYNNISLPEGNIFPGFANMNSLPQFLGSPEDEVNDKSEFREKFVGFLLDPNSPCIDAGDPVEGQDSDGTVPDLGVFEFVGNKEETVAVDEDLVIKSYPNPFNPTTNILYNVAQEGLVEIEIYNIKGQKVKNLINDYKTIGSHRVVWNGDNNRGKKVASGVYFVSMKQHKQTLSKKILLTK